MARSADQQDGPDISPEERARIAKAARQVVAYANFLRWLANFRRDEIEAHPHHARVFLLSPLQSGRFAFAIEDGMLLLGVQPFEAAWFSVLPFEAGYISDRLYLNVDAVQFTGNTLPALALGIYVDSEAKRRAIAQATAVQGVRMSVRNGHVANVGQSCGAAFPMRKGDVVKQLVDQAREKLRASDMGRFF